MYTKTKDATSMRPSISVLAVALAQLFAGAIFSILGAYLLLGTVAQYRANRAAGFTAQTPSAASIGLFFGILPLCFGLLSIVAGTGLFRLRELARKATIFLATVPVLGCALLVLLRPTWVFPPSQPDEQYALLTIGSGILLAIYEMLLAILTPVSVWWLVLFTRASVKAQFRTK